jgi:phosphoserine phosphatase RsbU/P
MAPIAESELREELERRRQRLQETIAGGGEPGRLATLLQEVDAALTRFDEGTYGLCEVCHDPVEVQRLLGDPLLRTCLDHLNSDERRALERDLDLAGRVQRGLLPPASLRHAGWEAFYHYEPAGAVGGDYCDLIPAEESGGDLYFLLGDVSGKGLSASMLMSALRATVRTLITAGLDVRTLMERANRLFCEGAAPNHFATLVCGRADRSGELEIANAGHLPPLLSRRGVIEPIAATGLPLGMFCSTEYRVTRLALRPGELLILYTDGLTETRDVAGREYGLERVQSILKGADGASSRDVVTACMKDLLAYQQSATRSDDLTLLALRRSR